MQAPMAPRRRNHPAPARSPPRADGSASQSATPNSYAPSKAALAHMSLGGESPLEPRSTKRPKLAVPSPAHRAPPFGLGATFALEAPSPMLATRSGGLREVSFGERRGGGSAALPEADYYGYRHSRDIPETPVRRPAFLDTWSPPASPTQEGEASDARRTDHRAASDGASSPDGSLSPGRVSGPPRNSLSPGVASVAAGLEALMRPSPGSASFAPPPPAPKRRLRPSGDGATFGSAATKVADAGFLRRGSLPGGEGACGALGGCTDSMFAPVTPVDVDVSCGLGAEEGRGRSAPCSAAPAPAESLAPPPYSRFREDFEELAVVGGGSFGTVYKVRSRLDGWLYAVKCTRRRIKGERDRGMMLKEVRALAELSGKGDDCGVSHIVRYHQAWIEGERLYIQTELCDTSLDQFLGPSGGRFNSEEEVWKLLRQILLGLRTLHQNGMVHLDVKPGNIFLKGGVYKLGDFGLVTRANAVGDVAEGDSRYMSLELLQEDHSDLTKSDVFSLGITLYELLVNSVAGRERSIGAPIGRPPSLPPNGEGWHRLRSGDIALPAAVPPELARVVRLMMQPDPATRPSAADLLRLPALQSDMERQLEKLSSQNQQLVRQVNELKHPEAVTAAAGRRFRHGQPLRRNNTVDNSFFSSGMRSTGDTDGSDRGRAGFRGGAGCPSFAPAGANGVETSCPADAARSSGLGSMIVGVPSGGDELQSLKSGAVVTSVKAAPLHVLPEIYEPMDT